MSTPTMQDRNKPRQDPQSEQSRLAVNEILRRRAVEQYWSNMAKLAGAVAAELGGC